MKMKKRLCTFFLAAVLCAISCTNVFAAQTHTVVSGDSMSKIAHSYGVSLSQVVAANPQVKNPNWIYPGQVLTIPADTSGTAAAAAAPSSGTTGSGAATAIRAISGIRAKQVPGYDMVEVPTNVISYDSSVVMNYIQEFANITQVPHSSYKTSKITAYISIKASSTLLSRRR